MNSFGASGTNAHVVLDDAYHYLTERGFHGNHCTTPYPSIRSKDESSLLQQSGQTLSTEFTGEINNRTSVNPLQSPRLLLLSAADKLSLQRMIDLHDQWLKDNAEANMLPSFLEDLVYTLTARRSLLQHRTFALLQSTDALSDLKANISSPIRATKEPQVGFVFTGQGAQWAGMAKELLRFPIFRDNVLESNNYLKRIGFSWDIWGKRNMHYFFVMLH